MKRLFSQIAAAALGLWIASSFVKGVLIELYPDSNFFGVSLTSEWQIILLLGISLGLLNTFIKPILKTITLPLRIITLGFFTILVNGFMIWIVDYIFKELTVSLWLPLLYTALIIWIINLLLSTLLQNSES